ncbi:MAG: ATP-binding protein [Burkholderiaceae bacterium]
MNSPYAIDHSAPGSPALRGGKVHWLLPHVFFATAAFLLLLLGGAVHTATIQAREAARLVDHAHSVLDAMGDARESFTVMEASQRGFLLTGREHFLEDRDEAMTQLRGALDRMTALTADNPGQSLRVRSLRTFSDERMRIATENAEIRLAVGFDKPWPVEPARAGRQAIAPFAELTDALHQEEQALLAQRKQLQREREAHTFRLLAIAFGAGVLVLIPAYGGTLYLLRRRSLAESRMADMVESLPLVVWRMRTGLDGKRRFHFVGGKGLERRGLDPGQVLRDPTIALNTVVDEDRQPLLDAMAAAQQDLRDLDIRYRVKTINGLQRWIHSSATLRREADGSVLWNGVWSDITEQKMLEESLEDANRELEAFSYTVSHDLRSPLISIGGFTTQLLRVAEDLDERSRHYIRRINSGARQMGDLIDGLLTLATINRAVIRREPVDISAMADSVVHELREANPGRHVEVSVTPHLRANGDGRLVRQLLANVIGNAWKFTGRKDNASIQVGKLARSATFFVKDNGVGFDMAHTKSLFNAFQRLHSDSSFSGTGIGLATVRRIVMRHGGKVWAESVPGEGTTLFFTLRRNASAGYIDANGASAEAPTLALADGDDHSRP